MDPRQYDAFDARLATLEQQARTLRAELNALARGPAAATTPTAAPLPEPDSVYVPPEPRAKGSLERLVAGRGLQIAGMLLVLLGAAFFLDLAFTRNWIHPAERILLGLVAGSALIALGARKLSGAYRFLNEGLVGLGGGILYLSLWATVAVYPELHVSRAAAFAAMIAVTAAIGALATVHRSERLAVMSLIGGFLTPALLASGSPDRVVLAAYLLLLSGGMLAIGVRSNFRSIEGLTLLAAFCYSWVFAPVESAGWSGRDAAIVATLFFAEFAAAFTLGALRSPNGLGVRVALLTIDVFCYAWALAVIYENAQTTLGVALLILAAALLVTARLHALPRAMVRAYGYLGLASVTAALPALLQAASLFDALSIEAALLVVLGANSRDRWIVIAGAALFAFTGLALIVKAMTDPPVAGAYSLATAFAIWLAAMVVARRHFVASDVALGSRRAWNIAASIAFNVVAWAGLSRLLLDLIGGPHWMDAVPNQAQFALSLLWTVYATALFGLGLARRTSVLLWQGLALFAVTIGKVFLVDLAALDPAYRVGSFVGLGIVLVAVSAWYTRSTMRRGTEGGAGNDA